MLKIKYIHLIIVLFFAIVVVGQNQEQHVTGKTDKTIDILLSSRPPYCFEDSNGKLKGILVDLWRLWGEKTENKVDFTLNPSPAFDAVLPKKDTNASKLNILGGVFVFRDMLGKYLIGESLIMTKASLRFPKSMNLKNGLADLTNQKIGIVAGTHAEKILIKHFAASRLARFPDHEKLLASVRKGDVKVFVMDDMTYEYLTSRNPMTLDLRVYHEPIYVKPLQYLIDIGQDNLQKMAQRGLGKISPNERDKIISQYCPVDEKADAGYITFACAQGYEPLSFRPSRGDLQGMLIDMWKIWIRKTSEKASFHAFTWDETIDAVENGEMDVHFGLFKTPDRERWLDFSIPFYEVESCVFYSTKLGEIEDITKLSGKTVGVLTGSYQEEYLRKKCPDARFLSFKTSDDMIFSASYGWLDAFIDEVPTAESILKRLGRLGDFNKLGNSSFKDKVHAAVLKGRSKLLAVINSGLRDISEPEMRELEKQWLANPKSGAFSLGKKLQLSSEEKKWLKDHPVIKVGADRSWPPFQFSGPNGAFQGIVSDYLELIEKSLGVETVIIPFLDWNEILKRVKSEELDLIPCISPTPERKKYLAFTKPYAELPFVAVVGKENNKITNLADLNGKRISVIEGMATQERMQKSLPKARLCLVKTTAEGLRKVIEGEAEAYVGNIASVSRFLVEQPYENLKIACSCRNQELCMGVRKDWSIFAGILDKLLKTITPEMHEEIRHTWVSVEYKDSAILRQLEGKEQSPLIYMLAFAAGLFFIALTACLLARRNAHVYKTFLESGENWVVALDKKSMIHYASPGFLDLLGKRKKDVLNTDFHDLLNDKNKWDQIMKKALTDSTNVHEFATIQIKCGKETSTGLQVNLRLVELGGHSIVLLQAYKA